MKKLIFLLLASCTPYKADIKMPVGICYYEGGDFGGTPDIIHCVQAAGNDGFLRCQGSNFEEHGWRWYSCGRDQRWKWLDKPTKVECPTPCPSLEVK